MNKQLASQPDFFEIAKKLTRAHSELAGTRYIEGKELEQARGLIRILVDQIWRMGAETHQAHHHEHACSWNICPHPLCHDATEVLVWLTQGLGKDALLSQMSKERNRWRDWSRELEIAVQDARDNGDLSLLEPADTKITCPSCHDYKPHDRETCPTCEDRE